MAYMYRPVMTCQLYESDCRKRPTVSLHISSGASITVANGGSESRLVFALNCPFLALALDDNTIMSFIPPPPPGMPIPPPGMPPPPPGMPSVAAGDPSSSRLSPEMLSIKSQKWIQMQKKRYGQKRKGGFVDMGKQVRNNAKSRFCKVLNGCALYRICLLNMYAKS
jgi:hypothetical protein